MTTAPDVPLHSLELSGDGDEIDAIQQVERRFGVELDYTDAPHWTTAGDVFSALQRALPVDQAMVDETWSHFQDAISQQTGVDPSIVTRETLLLGEHHLGWRALLLTGCLMGLAFAVIRFI